MKLHKHTGVLANVCSRTVTQDLKGATQTSVSSKIATTGNRRLKQQLHNRHLMHMGFRSFFPSSKQSRLLEISLSSLLCGIHSAALWCRRCILNNQLTAWTRFSFVSVYMYVCALKTCKTMTKRCSERGKPPWIYVLLAHAIASRQRGLRTPVLQSTGLQ